MPTPLVVRDLKAVHRTLWIRALGNQRLLQQFFPSITSPQPFLPGDAGHDEFMGSGTTH